MGCIINYDIGLFLQKAQMEFFITATGTGIGKTFITALLARTFSEQGMSIGVQKWVSTGGSHAAGDIEFIRHHVPALGENSNDAACLQAVYCLEFPASPHLAAEKENLTISEERIINGFLRMRNRFDLLLVEGAGGIMVPLTRKVMLVDLVEKLHIPSLVVAASGLGTINHTLLTLEALKRRKIACAGVVLDSQGQDPASEEHPDIVRDNAHVIEEVGGVKVLGVLPRVGAFDEIMPHAAGIGRRVLASVG